MTAVVIPSNLGADFDLGVQVANKINLVVATTTVAGKLRLAAAADLSAGTSGVAVDAAALKSAIAGVTGGQTYEGNWVPSTNTSPQLLSGVGTKGYVYKLSSAGVSIATTASAATSNSTVVGVASATGIVPGQSLAVAGVLTNPVVTVVSVSGSNVTLSSAQTIANSAALTFATYLDGVGPFYAGDSVAFDGTTWDKFDGPTEAVTTVAGRIGSVTLTAADVAGVATPASVTAQASVTITDAFGNPIGHALP